MHEQVVELVERAAVGSVRFADPARLVVGRVEARSEPSEELGHREIDLPVPAVHGGVDERGLSAFGREGVAGPEVAVKQARPRHVVERRGHDLEESVERPVAQVPPGPCERELWREPLLGPEPPPRVIGFVGLRERADPVAGFPPEGRVDRRVVQGGQRPSEPRVRVRSGAAVG